MVKEIKLGPESDPNVIAVPSGTIPKLQEWLVLPPQANELPVNVSPANELPPNASMLNTAFTGPNNATNSEITIPPEAEVIQPKAEIPVSESSIKSPIPIDPVLSALATAQAAIDAAISRYLEELNRTPSSPTNQPPISVSDSSEVPKGPELPVPPPNIFDPPSSVDNTEVPFVPPANPIIGENEPGIPKAA